MAVGKFKCFIGKAQQDLIRLNCARLIPPIALRIMSVYSRLARKSRSSA